MRGWNYIVLDWLEHLYYARECRRRLLHSQEVRLIMHGEQEVSERRSSTLYDHFFYFLVIEMGSHPIDFLSIYTRASQGKTHLKRRFFFSIYPVRKILDLAFFEGAMRKEAYTYSN